MAASRAGDGVDVGLRAHHTSPERTVFTEPDNRDGWIATDLTVAVER
jgi:hypothetical protein